MSPQEAPLQRHLSSEIVHGWPKLELSADADILRLFGAPGYQPRLLERRQESDLLGASTAVGLLGWLQILRLLGQLAALE